MRFFIHQEKADIMKGSCFICTESDIPGLAAVDLCVVQLMLVNTADKLKKLDISLLRSKS